MDWTTGNKCEETKSSNKRWVWVRFMTMGKEMAKRRDTAEAES